MRATYRIAALLAALAICSNVRAEDDAKKAQKLIDGRIKAIGGPKVLKKTSKIIFEDEGLYHGMGQGQPYAGRFIADYGKTSKFRFEILNAFIQVYDGKKAWFSFMDNTSELEGTALKAIAEMTATNYIISMVPLAKPNKEYKLSLAGSQKVDGEDCEGVNVSRKGTPEVTLFFSKKTGLLGKSSTTARASEQGYKEVVEESVYSDYEVHDGVKMPTKVAIFRDGKKYVDSKLRSVKFPSAIEDSEFEKP